MTDRFAEVAAVADAVLFEGYLLYPYRASAQKNQVRWQWGVLVPQGYGADSGETSANRTECLLEAKPGARLTDLQPFWQRVRARAGLKDVRIHDLRHTFASTAVAAGQGLPMIGKLLGHTQVQTTARYAHLAADPVKAAAEQVASNIAAFLNQAA